MLEFGHENIRGIILTELREARSLDLRVIGAYVDETTAQFNRGQELASTRGADSVELLQLGEGGLGQIFDGADLDLLRKVECIGRVEHDGDEFGYRELIAADVG